MLKAELKELWGNYCDTDKLVDDIMALLTKYHHENTEHGVCEMLDVYFFNKKKLIDMFVTSDNYIGNMRICLDVELERRANGDEVYMFCDTFADNVEAKNVFLKFVDEHGKSLNDYTRVGVSRFKARQLHYGNIAERLVSNHECKNKFDKSGATKNPNMS